MGATSGKPRFPDVIVRLSGTDGNAFAVLGKVQHALERAGLAEEVSDFRAEATAGDYDALLQCCMRWVTVQ